MDSLWEFSNFSLAQMERDERRYHVEDRKERVWRSLKGQVDKYQGVTKNLGGEGQGGQKERDLELFLCGSEAKENSRSLSNTESIHPFMFNTAMRKVKCTVALVVIYMQHLFVVFLSIMQKNKYGFSSGTFFNVTGCD